ncbi:MAG: hypothetical protein C4K60_18020 [Ideonella sp. MAG2]|nr:MAG: hypothetical protein C4K60_18020 [Ideonella sp. MAG2]
MADSAQVVQKKNEKHNHTDGKRKKARQCSCGPATAALTLAAGRLSSSASRCQSKTANTSKAHRPAHPAASRQEPLVA